MASNDPPRPDAQPGQSDPTNPSGDRPAEDPAGALGAMADGEHNRWLDQAPPDNTAESTQPAPGADHAVGGTGVGPDVPEDDQAVDPGQAFGDHTGGRGPDRRQIGAGPRKFVPK
jgi:hypothetical protein